MPTFFSDYPKPEVGIYYNVPFEEYLKWPCFSKSMISATRKSALHLKKYMDEKESTDSLTLGSYVDALLLDPKEAKKFKVKPETYISSDGKVKPFTMRANTCKQMVEDMEYAGFKVIDKWMEDIAQEMILSIRSNNEINFILENAEKQVSLVWVDEETGVKCKGRLDLKNDCFITDLKSSKDASKGPFSRDMHKFGYHQQAGMYNNAFELLFGAKPEPFRFIVAENQAPFCTALYVLDEESEEAGLIEARVAMRLYQSYLEQGTYTGYSPLFTEIGIPGYAKHQILMEGDDDTGI